jgi:cell division cycle protein 20 (cofactor of APC complex)
MDWSAATDKLAVGLGSDVYLWNQKTKNALKLFSLSDVNAAILGDSHADMTPLIANDSYITSLKWTRDGSMLAVGNSDHSILIWDVTQAKCVSQIRQHRTRVAALAFNGSLLSSGSLNGNILNHDIRAVSGMGSRGRISELNFHCREVCGLKWNSSGRFLASGSDDCLVCIWDMAATSLSPAINQKRLQPFKVLKEHKAAVKGLNLFDNFKSQNVMSK